jgi:cardiolipin synthase A/B
MRSTIPLQSTNLPTHQLNSPAPGLHYCRVVLRGASKVLLVLSVIVTLLVALGADPATLKLQSTTPVDAPAFADYVAVVTSSPVTAGDSITQLVNGREMVPAMLDAIGRARDRVNFFTYIFEPGEAADLFRTAFVGAARRGVRVTIVVDAFGASNMPAGYTRSLADAGCVVRKFRPFRWYSIQEASYRNHRKLLVIDGTTAFIGGAGIADHWLGDAQDPDHWRDTQFRIDGPSVPYLEAAFYEALAETSATVTPEVLPPGGVAADRGATRAVVVTSSPGGAAAIKRLFLLSIAAARHSIDITSPYFIADDSSEWALAEARRRNVAVRILVEGDQTDAMPVKWASRSGYERLLEEGIDLYEYQPTMMHAKTLVVDGIWSVIGSANFDNRSLDMNDELSVGVQDRALAGTLLQTFEQDLQRAHHITLDEWRRRPLHHRINEQAWNLFAELF